MKTWGNYIYSSLSFGGLIAVLALTACEAKKDGVLSGGAPTMATYSEVCYGQIVPNSGLYTNYMNPAYQVAGRNTMTNSFGVGAFSESKVTCKDDIELLKSASSLVSANSTYGFVQVQGLSCNLDVAQGVYVGLSVKLNPDNTVNSAASYLKIRTVDASNQSVDILSGPISGRIVGDQAQLTLSDAYGVVSLVGTVTTTSFKGTVSYQNASSSAYVLAKGVLGSIETPFCGTFTY